MSWASSALADPCTPLHRSSQPVADAGPAAAQRPRRTEKYGIGPAREYFLVHNGQHYDSKAIVGAAHGFAKPEAGPLGRDQFSGGEATVKTWLEELGFNVIRLPGGRIFGDTA